MAASMVKVSVLKSISSVFPRFTTNILNLSSRKCHFLPNDNSEDKIVMADNGSTIVCWHPEPKFPYECSLPIPANKCDVNQVLKNDLHNPVEFLHASKPQFQREYLMKVTSTTKHRWFPQSQKKFTKKTLPDREFL